MESEGVGRGGKGVWEINEMGEKEVLSSSFYVIMILYCFMVFIVIMI